MHQPVQRDLRHQLACFFRHHVQRIDHAVEMLLVDWRREGFRPVQPACFRNGRVAADLAGQPAPAERTPDQCVDALVRRKRHQLGLIGPVDQRIIVDLLGNEPGPAIALGSRQRLHQLPGRIVGYAYGADLPGRYQCIERGEQLFHRSCGIESMELEQVDIIRAEPAQGGFHGVDQAPAWHAPFPRPVARRKPRLGGDQDRAAPAANGFAQHPFGGAARIGIGGVEQSDSRLQADVDQSARFLDVAVPPSAKQWPGSAKGPAAEAEHRNTKPR